MSAPTNKIDTKATLNLPQTAFPMKADLAEKEPEVLKKWETTGLYRKIQEKNSKKPPFILHDGPPYANGSIHFGHILNKILKDIIVRYKSMSGFRSPYRPGWDCHGLPIEHEVDKELGAKKKNLSKLEIRKACREYANRFVEIQKRDFQRLGVLGEWDRPYLTMDRDYEATIAREFGKFVASGHIYKKKKPVLWCPNCQTALAEAEVEYEEDETDSIYVKFPLIEDLGDLIPKLKGKKVSLVIWTTTPWTLPANLAVAVHPSHDYVAIPHGDEVLILAKNLVEPVAALLNLKEVTPLERFAARRLELRLSKHPFLPKSSLVVLSEHVTVDTGTGAVHIAPGHGEEDYQTGLTYRLEMLTPVDAQGRFTDEAGVPEWTGLKVLEANSKVIEKLKSTGALLSAGKMKHSYPHCWRCKKPVIFRATEQWFLNLEHEDLRNKALDAIRRANWIPSWGRERIFGMIQKRPDWCLSRQRSWGVPIPSFRCRSCEKPLLDLKAIEQVAENFSKAGADFWFSEPVSRLLPAGTACPHCKGTDWTKEEDILDVWFDSGASFAAVLEKDPALQAPADIYLEGSDQHRGWFHSSLLVSVGTRGKAPYKGVVTHGFVVDGQGKKYSKSAKNYLPPDRVLQNGAEILRLWVAAEDYRNDIRVSDEILKRLVEAYRKIRNTCRFMLGNLYDFDPDSMKGTPTPLDSWAKHNLQKLIGRLKKAYEDFDFHIVFHELNRFCTVDLSAFYLDILKDRLYTSAKNDPQRRGAQKVLFETVRDLARLMAPILSFTAEEIWQHLPNFTAKSESVHLESFPEVRPELINEAVAGQWGRFLEIRNEILKALELARQEKKIGNALEAKLLLIDNGEVRPILDACEDLPSLLMVSQVEWVLEIPPQARKAEKFPTFFIAVEKADGTKCERCWCWRTTVGLAADHPTLCDRCVKAIA